MPERRLPAGVEIRPITDADIDAIWDAETEAFRTEWDSREPNEDDYREFVESPHFDPSMWKVAWAGDIVVGQVRSYVNRAENESRGSLRGYTEHISTHAEWRNAHDALSVLAPDLSAELDFAVAIEVTESGTIFLLDRHGGGVVVLDSHGKFRGRQSGWGWKLGRLRYPESLCVASGHMVISDRGNKRVQVFEIRE